MNDRPRAEVDDSQNEPEPDLLRVARELGALPEFLSLQRVRLHQQNYLIFRRNTEELVAQLTVHGGGSNGEVAEVWDVNRREKLHELQRDISRLMHNFLAAASSLIDTTRVLYNRYTPDRFSEYQPRIDSEFKNDALAAFVVCLRQYALHYEALPITSAMELRPGAAMTSRVYLDRARLDGYSGWNAPAKRYLAGIVGKVPLDTVTHDYSNKVAGFYQWFYERLETIHKADSSTVASKLEELRNAHYAAARSFLEVGLHMSVQGFGTPDDIFFYTLPPDDRARVNIERGPEARCELALARIREFVPVPEELAAGIRRQFAEFVWTPRESPG